MLLIVASRPQYRELAIDAKPFCASLEQAVIVSTAFAEAAASGRRRGCLTITR
jgi:hypothetical protein